MGCVIRSYTDRLRSRYAPPYVRSGNASAIWETHTARLGVPLFFLGGRTYVARMAIKSISRWLVLAPAAMLLAACAPKASTDPAPQRPTSPETSSADAGHPNVPLVGEGVIVPSDVKLDPGPKTAAQPSPGATSPPVAPPVN